MASIRKSFSFRNGVQVDEDNFIVNPNGLVGIGTSVPSEFLDVRGTAKVVGLTTTNDLFVSGVATATDIKVGTAISITNGGIAAARFYGDGATLSNLPTSQWEDINLGLGFTSIYAIGNVGIATTDPRQSFQVGGDPSTAGKIGVGINSIGNIRASGIITATSFVGAIAGPVTGDVVGNVTGDLTGNVTGNIAGNVTGNVNSSGVSTFTTLDVNGNVDIDGNTELDDLNVSGVATATSFVGPVTGDVTGNVTGNLTGNVTGNINSGITTASTEINVGAGGTAFTSLDTGKIGIGTAIPSSDITIKKDGDSSLEIIGETGITKVSIGKSSVDGDESALIRYGNPDGSLNIINYNEGSINSFLHAGGGSGTNIGRFSWIYGQTNAELLSLTHEGKVGVGKTNPDFNLEVVGTSTVTSNFGVGGSLDVAGDINLSGNIDLPAIIDGSNININTGFSTFNNVNIGGTTRHDAPVFAENTTGFYNAIGVNTMTVPDEFNLRAQGKSQFDFVGIGTTASPETFFNQTSLQTSNGLHLFNSSVGLNSCSIMFDQGDIAITGNATVGVGTTMPKSSVDFRLAGEVGLNTVGRFLIPPIVDTSERIGLATIAGGIVYNSDLNKLQCFDGTNWNNLF